MGSVMGTKITDKHNGVLDNSFCARTCLVLLF